MALGFWVGWGFGEVVRSILPCIITNNNNNNNNRNDNNLTVTWALWLERNNHIFEDIEGDVINVWDRIKFWVALWVPQVQSLNAFFVLDLLRGLDLVLIVTCDLWLERNNQIFEDIEGDVD